MNAWDVERHAKGFVSEAREWDQWAAFLEVPDWKPINPVPPPDFDFEEDKS